MPQPVSSTSIYIKFSSTSLVLIYIKPLSVNLTELFNKFKIIYLSLA